MRGENPCPGLCVSDGMRSAATHAVNMRRVKVLIHIVVVYCIIWCYVLTSSANVYKLLLCRTLTRNSVLSSNFFCEMPFLSENKVMWNNYLT